MRQELESVLASMQAFQEKNLQLPNRLYVREDFLPRLLNAMENHELYHLRLFGMDITEVAALNESSPVLRCAFEPSYR